MIPARRNQSGIHVWLKDGKGTFHDKNTKTVTMKDIVVEDKETYLEFYLRTTGNDDEWNQGFLYNHEAKLTDSKEEMPRDGFVNIIAKSVMMDGIDYYKKGAILSPRLTKLSRLYAKLGEISSMTDLEFDLKYTRRRKSKAEDLDVEKAIPSSEDVTFDTDSDD